MRKFKFLKAFFSPFRRPKINLYVGKIAIGTPYFYPRRWVKSKDKPGYLSPVPKKIGFDFVGLGWKTKWDQYDFRHEWDPIWSFVFFRWQIAVTFSAPQGIHSAHYWECWLAYEYATKKDNSKTERIAQCRTECPQVWTSSDDQKVDYYDLSLRTKYTKNEISK